MSCVAVEKKQVLEGAPILRFRGILLRHRCVNCNIKMNLHSETEDKVVLKCPACGSELPFFNLSLDKA